MNHLRNRQRSTCLIFRIEKLLNVLQTTKNRRAIFTSPHGALETPKKLGIEDASRSVEKRASIVRFAIVHLIADLNVLGPVPNDVGKIRLILCQGKSVTDSTKWGVDALAGMDIKSWGEIRKDLPPSSTASNGVLRCGIECLSNGTVVFSEPGACE